MPVKPLILAPGGFFDPGWYGVLLDKTKLNLDAITHHIYNLGPGSNHHLIDEILNPAYLEGCASVFSNTQTLVKRSGSPAVAWVGEAGGAYLDQLGMSAKYDTKTYCRQTLIGGNYGLLNTTTFEPNPDYYSALLWHRLMGRNVLSVNFTGSNMIRAYAHCARQSNGITILLINLSGDTTTEITMTDSIQILPREEYHLTPQNGYNSKKKTPQNGDLHSQVMLLNGKVLWTDSYGNIPILEPVEALAIQPLIVAPSSIVFVHIPSFYAAACN
ncbi:hypothetical protein LUZ60_002976 [Juncus effusus]|nr:hypothetical protein LUZ60_002976 [Juncus effusus]